jgi:hypothetical protein
MQFHLGQHNFILANVTSTQDNATSFQVMQFQLGQRNFISGDAISTWTTQLHLANVTSTQDNATSFRRCNFNLDDATSFLLMQLQLHHNFDLVNVSSTSSLMAHGLRSIVLHIISPPDNYLLYPHLHTLTFLSTILCTL